VQTVNQDDLARRVGVAWRELRRGAAMQAVRDRIYGGEVDIGQADALDVLVQHGPLRMSEIADALRVDASTATRSVGRLVDAGLAARTTAPGDARGVVVTVTRKGRARHERFSERALGALNDILAELEEGEQRQVAAALEQLIDAIDRSVGAGSRRKARFG
jgi:DNA-binding MarR family transcriptional regulator